MADSSESDLKQLIERFDKHIENRASETDIIGKWERRFEKHGWPAGFLVLIVFCIWQIVSWFAPLLHETFVAHWTYLKKSSETQEQQVENGKILATQISKLAEISDRQERRCEDIARKTDEVHHAVVKAPGGKD